jgi:drug/metabolite transporter (DMT)-like permease
VLASIVLWGEWPTVAQALGLLLAAAALPLLSAPPRGRPVADTPPSAPPAAPPRRTGVLPLATVTLLVSGVGLLAAKAFAELDRPEQRPVYVLACYVVATALGVTAWPWRSRFRDGGAGATGGASPFRRAKLPPERGGRGARSLALGALIGVVNIGQIWVLLPALAQVPGVLAFPLAAAGGLALAALGARLLWHERLGRQAAVGIGLAMAAAALANIR